MSESGDECPERMSADQMDEERRQKIAYEYLCRLEEARSWMTECLNHDLPPTVELEESMRNGVVLAKLSHFFAPSIVPEKKIFDSDEDRYTNRGLHFRHTDNIMYWRRAMQSVALPEVFLPETTDVYDKKNMPKAVFCLHALALYLYRRGAAPPMRDVAGDVAFTKEEIAMVAEALAEQGINLPNFSKIGGILHDELSADEAELHQAVLEINKAIDEGDPQATLEALQNPVVQMHFVIASRAELYQESLNQAKANKSGTTDGNISPRLDQAEDMYDVFLRKEEIQVTVDRVNETDATTKLNEALVSGSAEDCIKCLQDPTLRLPRVWPVASALYLKELKKLKEQKGDELAYGDILRAIHSINAAVEVNQAVDSGVLETLSSSLRNQYLYLDNVQQDNVQRYMTRLHAAKEDIAESECRFLDPSEIKKAVQGANVPLTDEEQRAEILSKLQTSVEQNDAESLKVILTDPQNSISDVNQEYMPVYMSKLHEMQKEGIQVQSFEELQEIVLLANLEVAQALSTCVAVVEINQTIQTKDPNAVKSTLDRNAGVLKLPVKEGLADRYADNLIEEQKKRKEKSENQENPKWYKDETASGCPIYVNLDTRLAAFETIEETVTWYLDRTEIVTTIQTANTDFLDYYQEHLPQITKSQAQVRTFVARRRFQKQLSERKERDEAATKIQRFFRRQQSLKDYQTFTQSDKPNIRLVRMFASLLKRTDVDYEEEIELEQYKSSIAKQIRSNRKLEDELSVMDVKIGLLVKNRLGVEEVMKQSERISKDRRHSSTDEPARISRQASVRKSNIDKLEAYQHLLYHLQTEPIYLTRLLLTQSSKVNRLIDSVVFPLFNYATQQREEYLMLNLLKEAMTEEVRTKVESLDQFEQVLLIVPKIIINLFRGLHGEAMLREMFEPLIRKLLDDKTDHLNTNPLEIYEYAVGKPPKDMSAEEAAVHATVAPVLEKSMEYLANWAAQFVDAIVDRPDHIPYGLRYMARVLKEVLTQQFPEASERDILKAVGFLVYDQYLYPGLTEPKAVGVYRETTDTISIQDQKKLGSVAKLVQCATANRGYGHENSYLAPLNPTILELHDKIRDYLANMCKVDKPEMVYGIDRYSDYVRVRKPTIFMAVGDLLFLHQLLLDNRKNIAPESNDPFNQLLDQIGTKVPSTAEAVVALGYEANADVSQAQISLALSCSHAAPVQDATEDDQSLFLRTKKLVLEIILCQSGDSIGRMLETPTTRAEEKAHAEMTSDSANRRLSVSDPSALEGQTLEEKKKICKQNLDFLESKGLVSKQDDYQTLLSAITADIRKERTYRKQRKGELERLQQTVQRLGEKEKYYDDQTKVYNLYIKGCLENLAPGYNKRRSMQADSDSKPAKRVSSNPIKTLKYSGEKLAKKGVLLSVNGKQENQLKGVSFEIKSSESPGVFEIIGKFPASEVESVDLRFQELLHAQYEGSDSVMLFHKAKFHVDELIFFLNKKFYCS